MTVRIDCTDMQLAEPDDPHARDLSVPPSDSAAECALLHEALWWPHGVRALRAVRLSELLYGFWEHQRIWESMQRVFDSAVWPLEPLRNTKWHAALEADCGAIMLGVVEDHWCDLNGGFHRRSWSDPAILPGHWLERLKRCKEARQLISNAQEQAERAWRLDVDGALAVAARMAKRREPIPVWNREAL